jgi:heme-degrading monooxygenase HmoA
MILEIAQIDVKPGSESEFESGVAQAVPLFQCAKGCRAMELQRSIERPQRYRLMVQWETLENHTVDFRQSADFQAWRALVSQFFDGAPYVEHTERCAVGFQSQR